MPPAPEHGDFGGNEVLLHDQGDHLDPGRSRALGMRWYNDSSSARSLVLRGLMRIYFDAGAQEVWLCDRDGQLQFFTADEKLATSALVPNVPERIKLD